MHEPNIVIVAQTLDTQKQSLTFSFPSFYLWKGTRGIPTSQTVHTQTQSGTHRYQAGASLPAQMGGAATAQTELQGAMLGNRACGSATGVP